MSRPYFNNPIPRTGMPNFPELSTLTSPREPDANGRMHYKLDDSTYNLTSVYHAIRQLQSQVNRMRIRPGSQSPVVPFPWQSPKELDPTVTVKTNTFVYISPQNTLVTTGLTDLILNELITAPAGIWQAVQDVPAQVIIDGTTFYNMPQTLASGPVTSSPEIGDADNIDVFWIPWAGVMICG